LSGEEGQYVGRDNCIWKAANLLLF
jgi:hypothetical protein